MQEIRRLLPFAHYATWGVLLAAFCAGLMIRLGNVPPVWWDEGWTMTVARTWLERGHYGLMLAGHPAPPGLAGALPVVASVVLSMRVLGVGIWQARLPMALICVGVLGLLYFLASDLYDRRIALLTWSVLLFTHGHPDLNVLIMGRQVLGEIPSLLFLLAGYYCLLVALRRRSWMIIPSIILWSVAVDTKAQALPFWAFSLLVPLSLSILKT